MKRDELVEMRKQTVARAERLRRVGDWGAGAADIRANTEDMLLLIDHLLERMK